MFLAGAETQQLFTRDERREVSWLLVVGTGIPFLLGLLLAPWLIHPSLEGPNGNRISLTIVLAVGVAVTSVPVVSKIFADLKILHTRFARLVLGVAVLEDIVLWLALAIATATAGRAVLHPGAMSYHLLLTVAFFILALTIVPRLIKLVNKSRFNVLARYSPTGYAISVLLAYCAVAGALDISLVFAAFLAGFAVVHKKRRLFAEGLEAIGRVSFAFFIPIYFALVGLKLDLIRGVSVSMILDREIHFQYSLNPARCQRTTVSGWTRIRAFRHPDQKYRSITQSSRSPFENRGCGRRRVSAQSCCRNARFSNSRSRRARKERTNSPKMSLRRRGMAALYHRKHTGVNSGRSFGERQVCGSAGTDNRGCVLIARSLRRESYAGQKIVFLLKSDAGLFRLHPSSDSLGRSTEPSRKWLIPRWALHLEFSHRRWRFVAPGTRRG